MSAGAHGLPSGLVSSASGFMRREHGALGHQALLDLAGQGAVPIGLVAVVESALVPVRPLGGHLMRCVAGPGREVHEPGLVRRRGLRIGQELQRLVSQVLGQVIPLGRGGRRIDLVVVVPEVGIPLIGQPTEKAVEAIEAPAQRPGPLRTTHRNLAGR